ncbi:ABC transporter permease [Roseomonas sp. BN140053]|uniref:ABC transporter permease n=1 Tax=Roseomonas sp. BN140053 TaxID=3391898 RepID=UPI0039EAF328
MGGIPGLLLRRFLVAVPILLAVSVLLFCVLRVLPLDPAVMSLPPTATTAEIAAKRVEMGLDLPLVQQYGIWLNHVLQGDFGTSVQYRREAGAVVLQVLPATIELALLAMVFATVLGLGGGLLLFYFRGGAAEAAGDVGAILTMSVPEFLWALLFLLAFGVLWPVLPFVGRMSAGMVPPGPTGFLLLDAVLAGDMALLDNVLQHLLLPAGAMGLAFAPPLMRVLRSSLLDAYNEDYIRLARLRGLSERRVLVSHALKNAILPTLTLMGVQFGFLFGGTMLVEVIYSYPGLGNLMVDAVRNVDLPIIQAVSLTYCVTVLLINTVVDGAYLALDPRLGGR